MTLARLHFINPDRNHPLALLPELLAAGLPSFQLRMKRVSDRELETTARLAVAQCHDAGAECIVDDRVDVAAATAADGVHVGASDLSVPGVVAVVGSGMHIGATARDPQTARQLVRQGASYLGVGPVFGSTSKDGLPEPIGIDGLAAVCDAVPIPVLAIAGITAARVPEVMRAGAHGIAVIGAISDADDPVLALRQLLDAIETAT